VVAFAAACTIPVFRLAVARAPAALGQEPAAPQEMPDDRALRAKFQDAQKRHLSGELDAARSLLKEVLDADPGNARLARSIARWLVRERGDFEGGEPFARRVHELEPRAAESASLLGACLVFTGRNAEAEAIYRAALEINPSNASLHHGLAMACGQQKRYLEARAEYARAIELDPNDGLIRFSAGENLANLREYEAAERELRVALKLDGHADAGWKLGEVLSKQGKDAEAENVLIESLERGPPLTRWNAMLQMGIFCFERGRSSDAAAILHRAARLRPEGRDAWMWLARAQRALGKSDAAARSLRRYQELRASEDRAEEERLLGLIRAQLEKGGAKEPPAQGER
jgi:tetratricopeptide (TPR) repeat protein